MSKACVLALVTDAFGGRGGIAQYNRDLIAALAGAQAIGAIEVLPRLAPDPAGPLPAKVRQRPAPHGRVAYLARAVRMAASLRPDIIFCGHANMLVFAAALARWTGARLVVQFHGVEAWTRPGRWRRQAIKTAALVFCVSRHTRAVVAGWADVEPERIVVIPNTVAADYRPGDRAAARRRLGLTHERVLLSVGRLDPAERYKGHDRVIRRLAALRARAGEVVYLIAGDGADRPRLEQLARDEGVAAHVRFLGHATGTDLPDLYRAADLFVLPSTGEGFGIVYLEAMACGAPALGLAEGGACDPLGDGELGDAVGEDRLLEAMAARLAAPAPDPQALSAAGAARFGRPVFNAQVAARIEELLSA